MFKTDNTTKKNQNILMMKTVRTATKLDEIMLGMYSIPIVKYIHGFGRNVFKLIRRYVFQELYS